MAMRECMKITTVAMLIVLICSGAAHAWDVAYEANVLPDDPSLGSDAWVTKNIPSNYYYYTDTTVEDGVLHLLDARSDRTVLYERQDPYLAVVTIEARVKVVSTVLPYPEAIAASFGASAENGQGAYLALFPNGICTSYGGSNYREWYPLDLTQFHVLRIALAATERQFTVWADGVPVFGGMSQSRISGYAYFGIGDDIACRADTYWDYVRYSKEYLPVPEPSSLLALAGGLAGLGGMALRRRRG